jgi:NhaA family Na+:H+ antiporter
MLSSGVHATMAGIILAFCIPMHSIRLLEHRLHWPITFLILPLFAFANAGIPLSFANLDTQMLDPVALGVIAGLVPGKLIGIAGATWLATRFQLAELPAHLDMRHIIGVGLLGGIGFTMSIFIAELGFAEAPQELLMAKTGILLASATAAITGLAWLWRPKAG